MFACLTSSTSSPAPPDFTQEPTVDLGKVARLTSLGDGIAVLKHTVLRYSKAMLTDPQKITFGEMRASGVRDVLSGQ